MIQALLRKVKASSLPVRRGWDFFLILQYVIDCSIIAHDNEGMLFPTDHIIRANKFSREGGVIDNDR